MNFQTCRLLISRFRVRDPGGSFCQNPLDIIFPKDIYSDNSIFGGESNVISDNLLCDKLNKGGGIHEDTGGRE